MSSGSEERDHQIEERANLGRGQMAREVEGVEGKPFLCPTRQKLNERATAQQLADAQLEPLCHADASIVNGSLTRRRPETGTVTTTLRRWNSQGNGRPVTGSRKRMHS
jgi:hypothetical protein